MEVEVVVVGVVVVEVKVVVDVNVVVVEVFVVVEVVDVVVELEVDEVGGAAVSPFGKQSFEKLPPAPQTEQSEVSQRLLHWQEQVSAPPSPGETR